MYSVEGLCIELKGTKKLGEAYIMKKFICRVCGYIYEGEEAPEKCPQCGAPKDKFDEMKDGVKEYADEHKVGVAKGVDERVLEGLRQNFTGECSEVGMYLAMSRVADREGYPEVAEAYKRIAFEEAEHASKFAELLGEVVTDSTKKNLEMRAAAEQGAGVDVYTHSEMLPAHYYPFFKKYTNFAGNYGNAWWKQKEEFETFNGPILMTSNCIVPPKDSYKDRLWTTGAAGYPGCKHIVADENGHKDFSALIAQAKECKPPVEIEHGTIVGGFAHEQVFALADKVVEAVKSGAVKKFVVMAGCDGRMKSRDYYTKFAEALPKDTIILTAGCAKYRYNKLNLGDIGGIPRVLDAGQCNDSYSLALIALKLKEVFGLDDVNKLPIVYNIAWYEQKAVIVLLALLYLGVKNIHLGPTLPAFLSPNVANVLVKNFGIAGIGSVEDDMNLFFGA